MTVRSLEPNCQRFYYNYSNRCHTSWSGELLQVKAIPLVKPKSMNGIFVILFNNIVQNIENFRAILVIFFKTYWTNFCIALGQTAGPIILIISLHKFSCLISKKDYLYITLFLFEIRRLNRRLPKIAHGWQKQNMVENSWNLKSI